MALALAWLQIGTATLSAGRKKAGDVKISDIELLVVRQPPHPPLRPKRLLSLPPTRTPARARIVSVRSAARRQGRIALRMAEPLPQRLSMLEAFPHGESCRCGVSAGRRMGPPSPRLRAAPAEGQRCVPRPPRLARSHPHARARASTHDSLTHTRACARTHEHTRDARADSHTLTHTRAQ